MKICKSCKLEKNESEFYKNVRSKDGLRSDCKSCEKDKARKWKVENLERSRKYEREWREKNKEWHREYSKNIDKEKKKLNSKKWNEKYYLEIRNYKKLYRKTYNKIRKERRKNDPLFKLSSNIRSSIYTSLKEKEFIKSSKTEQIIGLLFREFKLYIESKFETWMTWENYGKYNGELNYGWDLDHILPISSAKTEEDILKLNHYTNFQPLCSKINRDIKRNILNFE